GVEDVGGRQPVVDPPPRLAGRRAEHVDERGDVVVGDLLPLLDRLDGERRQRDGLQLARRRPLGLQGAGDLHLPPALELGLVGPDGPDLGAGVARDHALRIRSARCPAFLALSRPTQATGTPGGIWATDSSASSPPAADSREDSGTPMTGRSVWAAETP